jgi:hypothetical protein
VLQLEAALRELPDTPDNEILRSEMEDELIERRKQARVCSLYLDSVTMRKAMGTKIATYRARKPSKPTSAPDVLDAVSERAIGKNLAKALDARGIRTDTLYELGGGGSSAAYADALARARSSATEAAEAMKAADAGAAMEAVPATAGNPTVSAPAPGSLPMPSIADGVPADGDIAYRTADGRIGFSMDGQGAVTSWFCDRDGIGLLAAHMAGAGAGRVATDDIELACALAAVGFVSVSSDAGTAVMEYGTVPEPEAGEDGTVKRGAATDAMMKAMATGEVKRLSESLQLEKRGTGAKAENQYNGKMYEQVLTDDIRRSIGKYDSALSVAARSKVRNDYEQGMGHPWDSTKEEEMEGHAAEGLAELFARLDADTGGASIEDAERVGEQVKNEDGDIALTMSDGSRRMVEIKYANKSSGTWLGTSTTKIADALNSLERPSDADMGRYEEACSAVIPAQPRNDLPDFPEVPATDPSVPFPSYSDFLRKGGYYEWLDEASGEGYTVKAANNSPMSQADSSRLRHTEEGKAAAIAECERRYRRKWCSMLTSYMEATGTTEEMGRRFLTKEIAGKGMADYLLVTDSSSGHATCISREQILNNADLSSMDFDEEDGKTRIRFGGLSVEISWQNGVGLNNPTARVFLDEGLIAGDWE